MWQRRSFFIALGLRNRSGGVACGSFRSVPVADGRRANVFQFPMGHFAHRDRLLIDLFRSVATVAAGTAILAGVSAPGYSAYFARGFVFAQASSVQTDADVGRGEINQRRRQLVESYRAGLPLLVATIADGFRVVGRQEP